MKIRELVSGIASGYLAKGVQFLISIALVPFYLRDDILGLEGYGRAFTILAATQFLVIVIDGLRLSFTRDITQAVSGAGTGSTPGEALGSGIKTLLVLCTLLSGGLVLLAGPSLSLMGIEPSDDSLRALWLASALFWVENGFQLLAAPLIARGSISFVNLWLAIEAVARAVAMVVLLSALGGSLTIYFAIYLALTSLRQLVYWGRLRRTAPGDLAGALRAPLAGAVDALRYSLAVSLYSGVNVIMSRVPIVLANRFLGPDVSGLVAIVINTIRGYFHQMLFTVLQPLLVPVGAMVDPRRLSDSALRAMFDLEAVYTLVVAGALFSASAVMPFLLDVWLGGEYVQLTLSVQLVLIGSAVEFASTVRRSILLGQGFLLPTALRMGWVAVVFIALSAVSAVVWESWQGLIACVGAFLVFANAWAVGTGFRRAFPDVAAPHWGRTTFFLLVAGSVAIGLSRLTAEHGVPGAIGALAASGLVTLLSAHFLLLRLPRGWEALVKLRRSGERSLAAGGEPADL